MKCNECQEALSAYYDHKLNEEAYHAVQVHLKECKTCGEEYRLFVQMIESLKDDQEITVPVNVHEKMLNKVKKESSKKRIISISSKHIEVMVATLLIGVMWYGINPLKLHISEETTKQAEGVREEMSQSRSIQMPEVTSYVADEMEVAISNEIEIAETQLWQIETEKVFILKTYLKDYARQNNLILESIEENEISFTLQAVKDKETLFDTLADQDFTRSLIRITNVGENIKIIVKA